MASMMTEEQFRCVICQDMYNRPVSIPCGHNFCVECIQMYWDSRQKIDCPLCKEVFLRRPETRVNAALKDITENFKRHVSMRNSQKPVPAQRLKSFKGDQVPCDVCPANSKLPAVKSCQVCQVSFCQTHLKPHLEDPVLETHRLSAPVASPAGLCRTHNKRLDRFCVDHKTPVCSKCTEHQQHKVVSMETESRRVKAQLRTTEADFQRMLQSRLKKVEEIQAAVEHSKVSRDRELEASVKVFDAAYDASEINHALLIDEIEHKQEEVEKKAMGHLNELQQEIGELQRRCGELQVLETTSDPVHLLQSFSRLSATLPARDWSGVRVRSCSYLGTIRRSVSKVLHTCHELEKELSAAELRQTRKHAVDVTLDAATAACWVLLSPNGKQVSLRSQPQKVPDDTRRFDSCVSVLGMQGFTTGRRYWEVQVGDKSDWDLGVARESISRKGAITVRPDNGYWAICRRKGSSLSACAGPSVTLHLAEAPKKVGVFLDYEAGVVSFYNAEANTHIYTYAGCSFTERMHPYFNPCLHDGGRNTAPLLICPLDVRPDEHAVML